MQGAACAMQKSTGAKGNHEDNVLYVETALQTPICVILVDHLTQCLSQKQRDLCMCGYTKILFETERFIYVWIYKDTLFTAARNFVSSYIARTWHDASLATVEPDNN